MGAPGAHRVQLVESAAGGGDEQKRKERVHHRGEPTHRRARPESHKPAVLRVGLAHRRGMRDKEVAHGALLCRYRAAIKAIVVSSMRFEKPHSLSYHEDTLTSLPETLVSVASKTEERASWLKSIETSGAVL